MNETDSMEADNIEVKEELHRHESSNDWDDLGIDFENASQTVSTNESSNTPKPRSNLDEVIDAVIQDALEYADAPPEKRVLPKLVRKSTKSRSKQVNNSNNTNSNFSAVTNHQMSTNNHTANALMTQAVATNNAGNNPLHPLMQANFGHPNMQQMAAQLQLAASSKGIVAGGGTNAALMQHNMISSGANTNNQTQQQQQQQQQLTAAMMGFGASQIPNMMMPTYNGSVPITYHQQMASGQYHLPVTFAQIQQLHQQQQQQQQTQQHQQSQQSHLLLGNNQNSTEMTAGNSVQQNNMNFATGSTTNPQQQQTMLPTSYANFPNQAISVTPYQIPGMMHAFASPPGSANSSGTQLMSANATPSNMNGASASNANSRYSLSSSNSSTNNSVSTTTNIVSLSNNNPSIALSSSSSSGSNLVAASMASLYQQQQQLPNPGSLSATNPFDFHQHQLLYNQRLLQAQQQQSGATNAATASILSDYSSLSRYGGGYQ